MRYSKIKATILLFCMTISIFFILVYIDFISARTVRNSNYPDTIFYSSTISERLFLNDDFILYEAKRYIDPIRQNFQIVDLGCGFPPITTKELAERLYQHYPNAQLYGIDNKFPESAVISADDPDKVALFDEKGNIIGVGNHLLDFNYKGVLKVHKPTVEEQNKYTNLKSLLETSSSNAGTVIHNLKEYFLSHYPKLGNLKFINAGFDFPIENVDIIRIANMIEFYNPNEQANALKTLKEKLRQGGILVLETDTNIPNIGKKANNYLTIIYQKSEDKLELKEVEFSLPVTLSGTPSMSIGNFLLRFNGDTELGRDQDRIRANLTSPEGNPNRDRSYVTEMVRQLNDLGYKAFLREHTILNETMDNQETIYTIAVLYYPNGSLKQK